MPAALAELSCQRVELGAGLGQLLLPGLECDVGMLELLSPGAAALGVGEDLGDRAAVLALQPGEQGKALLDLLQRRRTASFAAVCFELEQVGAQLLAEVFGLVAQCLKPLGHGFEPCVDPCDTLELSLGLREQLRDPSPTFRRDRLRSSRRREPERVEVAQPVTLGDEACLFLLTRGDRFDLVELEREQVELALARAGHLPQLGDPLLGGADALVGLGEPFSELHLGRAAVSVQDVELCGGEHQLAVLMLSVEGHQAAPQVAQVRDRGRPAADVRASPAVGPHPAGQHDLLRIVGQPFGQLGVERARPREDALHICLGSAASNDAASRSPAEQQVERLGQQGLACTRLAGEHVQARGQAKLGPIQQQEILDAQLVQHAARFTRRRRRTGRARGDERGRRGWVCRHAENDPRERLWRSRGALTPLTGGFAPYNDSAPSLGAFSARGPPPARGSGYVAVARRPNFWRRRS